MLSDISQRTHALVDEQYRLLNEELIPALENEGIRFVRRTRWRPAHRDWLRDYFHREIEPVLSPTSLDPARPFPKILNKSLNFIVGLKGMHAFGRPVQRAIVQAPRSLPRLIRLDPSLPDTGPNDFVFLSSVIHAFVDELFTGMEIQGCHQFRVTRNSDLYVETEEVDDLMRAVEGELISARYGEAVRLEIAHDCPGRAHGLPARDVRTRPRRPLPRRWAGEPESADGGVPADEPRGPARRPFHSRPAEGRGGRG